MIDASIVLLWVLVVAVIVLGAAWWATRREHVPPVRDSELVSTDHVATEPPPIVGQTVSAARVWREPAPEKWVRTIPSDAMPLDEADHFPDPTEMVHAAAHEHSPDWHAGAAATRAQIADLCSDLAAVAWAEYRAGGSTLDMGKAQALDELVRLLEQQERQT